MHGVVDPVLALLDLDLGRAADTDDGNAANTWGQIVARREAAGRPIGVMDAFIAATAETHGLTLVTRSAADFESAVTAIVTPWRPK